MTGIYSAVSACFSKTSPNMALNTSEPQNSNSALLEEPDNVGNTSTNKKVSSRIYDIGSGVMSYGVGGVKWAANTTYNVSASLVSVGKTVLKGKEKPKAD